ncbi:MAG: hypothetical protein A2902_01370 [Elusimicrobia bacterium RIFCSPLOWO2_01_FULL_64_13]|nr:MAG: hypothetical protein A2636_03960 [Elusimicrobia bacterium RIFCSPHIGHO2_01_FULL_64_10]OGR97538.1 MAG: hypothetical protein A2902_01370 [Elusimicrobia bacterium RIFCSPLOWO2_01_FULL_64_13]
MRLSEIFRERQNRKNDAPRQNIFTGLRTPDPAIENSRSTVWTRSRAEEPRLFSALVHEPPDSKKTYGDLVRLSERIIAGLTLRPVKLPDLDDMCETVGILMEDLEESRSAILAWTERSTLGDYLAGHTANVTVISIAVSQEMGWPAATQLAVGVAALLHDAGLAYNRALTDHGRPLSRDEKLELTALPRQCLEILDDFLASLSPESRGIVEKIILQYQERVSGEGYPGGLRDGEICEEAQLVGLCDTYEALCHPRPHKKSKLSHEALRVLIEMAGRDFDGSLIKSLWETLTLFPPGSFVKLNTGELARVLRVNKSLPTRPKVQVMAAADGSRAKASPVMDLSQTPGVVIDRAVDECSAGVQDPGLLIELKAQKWWIPQ